MEEPLQVEFRVRYRLGEYLHIVRARALATPQLVAATPVQRALLMPVITAICAVLFLRKSWRVGECHFRIDPSGITRRSKGGREVHVPWADVSGAKAFSVGYLIEIGDGGMPIPFRVLSGPQQAALAALLQPYLGQSSPSSPAAPHHGEADTTP